MRRPAQHRLGPTAASGWAHPYTGIASIGVFYNDGGQAGTVPPAPAPPVPSPGDLATRVQQAPPAPPVPLTQRISPDDQQPLIDTATGQPMTQGRLSQIMAKQFDKSRRNAYREMAEAAGIPFDPETFDPTNFAKLLKEAQDARQQALTEEQRRTEDLDRREQEVQTRLAAAEEREKELAKKSRSTQLEAALVRLGAVDTEAQPNLQDAFAMLERDLAATPEADATAVQAAADKLKQRRPELFGAPAAQTLPPAPSGGPAAGGTPRPPAAGKDAINQKAQERARAMGLRRDDAA